MSKGKKSEEEKKRIDILKTQLGYKNAYELVDSELQGVYDEIDKLCKKAPNEPITNLQLGVVNRLIEKSKRLLDGDRIVGEISSFVAAGDNPEYRDVLTVLRQLRQGLQRFKVKYSLMWRDDPKDELSELGVEVDDVLDIFESEGEEA